MLAPVEQARGAPLHAAGSTLAAARKRADGAESLFAPRTPASAQNPAFAPDGATLLFTLFSQGFSAGPASLQRLTLLDLSSTALFSEAGYQAINAPGASWNAANRIAFSSDRLQTNELWYVQGDGTALTRVTRHTWSTPFVAPTYSPDGSWIVFEVDSESGADKQGSIWKVRTDGSGLIRLTNGPGQETDDRQPQWSPRGDRILFQRRSAGGVDWNLFTMDVEGGDVRPVTTSPAADVDGSWSPDGEWIVYASNTDGLALPALFTVAAVGGTPVRLTHDDASVDSTPVWSPDGLWIAFASHPGLRDEAPTSLWRIAAPELTPAATVTPTLGATATATPVPTSAPTPTPVPTATPTPAPTRTASPTPTASDIPAAAVTWTWANWEQAAGASLDPVERDFAGQVHASLEQWLTLRSALASVVAATLDPPAWALTDADVTRQGTQRLGLALAEGVSVVTPADWRATASGEALRQWIAAHQAELYGGESAARVALVYSPRNRNPAAASTPAPSAHWNAFRAVASALYRAHIPFDVVPDTDLATRQGPALERAFQYGRSIVPSQSYVAADHAYAVLILPEVQAMSEDTAAALRFSGSRLITIGATGTYDDAWRPRTSAALAGVSQLHLTAQSASLPTWVDDGLLRSDAPESVQMHLRSLPTGWALLLVNTGSRAAEGLGVELALPAGQSVRSARLCMPGQADIEVPWSVAADGSSVHLDVPAGLDTLGLLSIVGVD